MTSAPPTPAPATARTKRRGTETARDMVLSLFACLLVVVPFVLLNQTRQPGERQIEVIDPSPALASLRQTAPDVPVPVGLVDGWRPTSTDEDPRRLRVAYVTPGEEYAEYLAVTGEPGTFLAEVTGDGTRTGELQVDGQTFEVWSNDEAATSLVLREPGWTVVVGGLRETADDSELQQLAGSLTAGPLPAG